MPKHLTITIPHDLGAAELRRWLDKETDWVVRRLENDNIQIAITDWSENARSFRAKAMGQDIAGALTVADDTLRFEATLPWTIGIFSPVIEAAAKHYAARLLAPV